MQQLYPTVNLLRVIEESVLEEFSFQLDRYLNFSPETSYCLQILCNTPYM